MAGGGKIRHGRKNRKQDEQNSQRDEPGSQGSGKHDVDGARSEERREDDGLR